MSQYNSAWEKQLGDLNRELETIGRSNFKAAQLPALASARQGLIDAMRSTGFNRYEIGMAAGVYRELFKQAGKQPWRDEVDGAGLKIAKLLGWADLKSLSNLIADAGLADELGETLRNAMVARACDPAARKYRDIVKVLVDQCRLRTLSETEAADIVDAEFKTRSKRRSEQLPADATALQEQLVTQIVRFVMARPSSSREEVTKEIFSQVNALLDDERKEAVRDVSNQPRVPKSFATADLKHSSLVGAPMPAGLIVGSPRVLTATQRRHSELSVPVSKQSHPWGDECLNTLKLLDPGPDGRRQGAFNRELLYDILDDRQPKRYMVGEQLDLFDPGVDDKYFDEHMQVFLDAKWHTFGALTRHVDSLRRHIERWKHNHKDAGFPINFWPGVTIDCPDQLERMKSLHGTPIQMFWVSFVGYRSERSKPLSSGGLDNIKKCSPQLLAFGWDFAQPNSKLTIRDARTLAERAKNRSTCYHFFTHPESRANFIVGAPRPEFAHSINQEGGVDVLLAQAEALRDLPRGWFSESNRPKELKFPPFKGDPVELFDYRP